MIAQSCKLVIMNKTKPGGARAKELELSEQSALLKEQMQKERDAGAHFQKELQVF